MSLSRKQIENIVKERTYFTAGLDVDSGEVVFLDGKFVEEKDGEIVELKKSPVPEDRILYIRYDENVEKKIRDFLPRVLNQRGITNPDEIDVNHTQVQAKIKEIRKMPGRNRKLINEDETNAVVEMVRKAHNPQYMLSLMQVVLWSMVRDDLFKLSKEKSGINLNVKFDYEVPEEYWERDIRTKSNTDDDLLYDFVTDAWKIDFKPYDKSNPLEVMLAYATVIIDTFPELTENIGIFQSNVIVAFSYGSGGVDFDDAMFLNSELDSLLRKPVVRKYAVNEPANVAERVHDFDAAIPVGQE